jgi:transposase
MRRKSVPAKEQATQIVKNIRRATRRHFSAEDKIRIVLEGLRGEDSIAELCRREGIVQNLYYRWSKDFLEAGKKRLAGDTARAATSDEVKDLRREAGALKEVVAELTLENRLAQKPVSLLADTPQWVAARSTFPAQTLPEMTAWMKANPGKATVGTVGVGGPTDIAAIHFQKLTGTSFQLVPYRS